MKFWTPSVTCWASVPKTDRTSANAHADIVREKTVPKFNLRGTVVMDAERH
jgi:hypothetical protein